MSKIKIKLPDGSEALLPLGGISEAAAKALLNGAKRYTDEEIEKLRKNMPSGGITEEDLQEILAQIPDEVSVTDNEDEPFPEGADIQIVLGGKEEPSVNAVFAAMVKASLNKETWTFTIDDGTENGTTVQKVVYVE